MFTVETKSLDFDGSMFIFNCNATFLGQKVHAARELMIAWMSCYMILRLHTIYH